jgi:Na+-transporting NADH:ubiquinone oxidoreductase subunit C
VDMSKEKKKAEEERKFPLYVYDSPEGKLYLLSVRGSGLWDEIWGTVALKPDLNTIAGVAFDHKAETPGLGAEIKDNPAFPEQFKGKELYNKEGEYVAVNIRKGGVRDKAHDIDVISGATVTSVGVEEMLYKGIKSYQPYLSKIQGGKQLGSLK